MATDQQIAEAENVVWGYTAAATATGAVPVPAASAAVVAETAAMLTHLKSVFGAEITWNALLESLGFAASLNIVGRTLFVEGAKLLGWGTGNVWAAVALSGLGATTAGVQTFILGKLAIEIGKNGGRPITPQFAAKIIDDARAVYERTDWKKSAKK